LFAIDDLQDRIEVDGEGGRVNEDEDSEQSKPAGAETVRPTVLANPFIPVTVIVAFPSEPTSTADGTTLLAAMVKSTTIRFTRIACASVPLVAVIVSV